MNLSKLSSSNLSIANNIGKDEKIKCIQKVSEKSEKESSNLTDDELQFC